MGTRDALRPQATWYSLEEGGKHYAGPAPDEAFSFGFEDGTWWNGCSQRMACTPRVVIVSEGRCWPENGMVMLVMDAATRKFVDY